MVTPGGMLYRYADCSLFIETGVRRLERNEKIGLYAIVLPKEQINVYS